MTQPPMEATEASVESQRYLERFAIPPIVVFISGCVNGFNGFVGDAGAYACVLPFNPELSTVATIRGHTTRPRARYLAAIAAIGIANEIDPGFIRPLHIITDDDIINNSMSLWIEDWSTNGWRLTNQERAVSNLDLILQIYDNLRPWHSNTWRHFETSFVGDGDEMRAWAQASHDRAVRLAERELLAIDDDASDSE